MKNSAFLSILWLAMLAGLSVGCSTPAQTAALAAAGVTWAGSRAPAQELEQIYYLGVFDPEEQVPPSVYRLTVRGQASALSATRFASGWVPAGIIDSLNGRASLDALGSGDVEFSQTNTNFNSTITPGRRLMMFGPEGFREAPANHRLVIVMGADPKGFFETVDSALGEITSIQAEKGNVELEKRMFESYVSLSSSRRELERLKTQVQNELVRPQETP